MSLPPLPEPDGVIVVGTQAMRAFTAATLEKFAEAAVAAEREHLFRGGVLVRLDRIEGYEEVHPQLLAEDARIDWPSYEVLLPDAPTPMRG